MKMRTPPFFKSIMMIPVLCFLAIIGLTYFLVQSLQHVTMESIGSSVGDFTRAYNESVEGTSND